MSNKDYAAANSFINWIIDLIEKISDLIKYLFGNKEDPAPAADPEEQP